MRMHTALHLMCSLIPFPVTGGSIGAEESRLDFDIAEAGALDKEELSERLNALVAADHPITTRWISDEELADNPGLVRTMSVKPPTGSGRVRLVSIGVDDSVDLQPCGGTHVRSTGEIGRLMVSKIEKKGRQNRRVRLAFAERTMSGDLVTPEWLNERLGRPGTKVVDALLVSSGPEPRSPGRSFAPAISPARSISISTRSPTGRPGLPHTMPDEATFAAAAGALGLSEDDTIVVYDGMGIFSAARVWWMLRTFGAKDAHVLDGGPAGLDARRLPLESPARRRPAPATFHRALRRHRAGRFRCRRRRACRAHRHGRRRALRPAFPRRGARAAPRRPRRPHAGRAQRPL